MDWRRITAPTDDDASRAAASPPTRETYLLLEVQFMLRRTISASGATAAILRIHATRFRGVLLVLVVAVVVIACNNGGGSGY